MVIGRRRKTPLYCLKTFLFGLIFSKSGFVCVEISSLTPEVLRVRLGKQMASAFIKTQSQISFHFFSGTLTRTVEYACDESQFREAAAANHLLLLSSGTRRALFQQFL